MSRRDLLGIVCSAGVVACGSGEEPALVAASVRALEPAPADAVPVPADYDGDGITDIAVKGSNGIWYIDGSRIIDEGSTGRFGGRWSSMQFDYGGANAVPVPGDYDGDGRADLAVKDGTGLWAIDFASNGFGVWDLQLCCHGDSSVVPAPADYDGDGKTDIAIKTTNGDWYIDGSRDGFGPWDHPIYRGYGAGIPVPGQYDGNDRMADLAVAVVGASSVDWFIDFARNGYGHWDVANLHYPNVAGAKPAPGDYDRDGVTDIAFKDINGVWLIDFARNGFGSIDSAIGFRGGTTIPVPGDYDGDDTLDLAVVDSSGFWLIDYAANGFTTWDVQVDNPHRVLIDSTAPWIDSTVVEGVPPVGHTYPVIIGKRYTVAVHLQPGNGLYTATPIVNADLGVRASLNVVNPKETCCARIPSAVTRRFSFTPSQPGSFPLGFAMLDSTNVVFNRDYGIRVAASAEHPGLYGFVTSKATGAVPSFITVKVNGAPVAVQNGFWNLTTATGGPFKVEVTASQHSPATAVNVNVPPGSGVRIDTPLEEHFGALLAAGMTYTTFLDYSRGRTIMHTVAVDRASSVPMVVTRSGPLQTAVQVASQFGQSALVAINGGYFLKNPLRAEGYYYEATPVVGSVLDDADAYWSSTPNTFIQLPHEDPMFVIKGFGTSQQFSIVNTQADFLNPAVGSVWNRVPVGPIYDPDKNGISDADYAIQASPWLLRLQNGQELVMSRVFISLSGQVEVAWARTVVGVSPQKLFLVVADGEGVPGSSGATPNQMGEFFRDALHATDAMNFDGGGSTQMAIRAASGPRLVNVPTSEFLDVTSPAGTAFTFLTAGRAP